MEIESDPAANVETIANRYHIPITEARIMADYLGDTPQNQGQRDQAYFLMKAACMTIEDAAYQVAERKVKWEYSAAYSRVLNFANHVGVDVISAIEQVTQEQKGRRAPIYFLIEALSQHSRPPLSYVGSANDLGRLLGEREPKAGIPNLAELVSYRFEHL